MGSLVITVWGKALTSNLILQTDPNMASAMHAFQTPGTRAAMEERMKVIKEDPELAPILKEIEESGPAALMKYVLGYLKIS